MKISKLAFIALLGGALMAFGCSDDPAAAGSGGSGGMATPTCDAQACLFCPLSVLEGLGAAAGGDINAPIEFTAEPQGGDPVAGGAVTIEIKATSTISDLPLSVTADVKNTSTTTYDATSGGTGTIEVPIPEDEYSGTTLTINGGMGSGEFMVDPDATELVIQLTAAVIDLDVSAPIAGPLKLDASSTGPCTMLGDGVTIPVDSM